MSIFYLNKSLINNGLLIPKNKIELHGSWRGIIYLYNFNTDRFVYSLQHLGKTKIFRYIIIFNKQHYYVQNIKKKF